MLRGQPHPRTTGTAGRPVPRKQNAHGNPFPLVFKHALPDAQVVAEAESGVNVIVWFSINLSFDTQGQPALSLGINSTCIAEVSAFAANWCACLTIAHCTIHELLLLPPLAPHVMKGTLTQP